MIHLLLLLQSTKSLVQLPLLAPKLLLILPPHLSKLNLQVLLIVWIHSDLVVVVLELVMLFDQQSPALIVSRVSSLLLDQDLHLPLQSIPLVLRADHDLLVSVPQLLVLSHLLIKLLFQGLNLSILLLLELLSGLTLIYHSLLELEQFDLLTLGGGFDAAILLLYHLILLLEELKISLSHLQVALQLVNGLLFATELLTQPLKLNIVLQRARFGGRGKLWLLLDSVLSGEYLVIQLQDRL